MNVGRWFFAPGHLRAAWAMIFVCFGVSIGLAEILPNTPSPRVQVSAVDLRPLNPLFPENLEGTLRRPHLWVDRRGNHILVASFEGSHRVTPQLFGPDEVGAWVRKWSPSLEPEWLRVVGNGADKILINRAAFDANGATYVIALKQNFVFGVPSNQTNGILEKIDSAGALKWHLPIEFPTYDGQWLGQAIGVHPSGNDIWVTGARIDSALPLPSPTNDVPCPLFPYILKLDGDGNETWRAQLTGVVDCRTILPDIHTNAYITGFMGPEARFGGTQFTNAGRQGFITKLSPTGEWLWVKPLGWAPSGVDFRVGLDRFGTTYVAGLVSGIQVPFDPLAVVSPSQTGNAMIASYSSDGELRWRIETKGAPVITGDIAVVADEHIHVSLEVFAGPEIVLDGWCLRLAPGAKSSSFVVVLDPEGKVIRVDRLDAQPFPERLTPGLPGSLAWSGLRRQTNGNVEYLIGNNTIPIPTLEYDTWSSRVLGHIGDSRLRRADADPDGDQIPNIVEFTYGMNPLKESRAPSKITARRFAGSFMLVEASIPVGAGKVKCLFETSTDLIQWQPIEQQFVPVLNERGELSHSGSVRIDPNQPRVFSRMVFKP